MEDFIPKEKYDYGFIGDIVIRGLMVPPLPHIVFAQSPADKRQYWLEFRGNNTYYTSITKGKWNKMTFDGKFSLYKYWCDYLTPKKQGKKGRV